jgi:hypothetical protein
VPAVFPKNAPFQKCGDDVVAILENVRLDQEILADHALDRITTAINQWFEVLDNSAGKGPWHAAMNQLKLAQWERRNRVCPTKIDNVNQSAK